MGIQFDINETFIERGEEAEPALLKGVDESVERTNSGWDNYKYPRLLAAVRSLNGEGLAAMELPMPPFPHPLPMMTSLAELLRRGPGPLDDLIFRDDSFYGWILLTEGWTVPRPSDTAPKRDLRRWHAAAEQNLFHLHPDRVEERLILLVTRYDRVVFLQKDRGREPKVFTFDPETTGQRLSGSVVQGLKELVEVSLRWLPPVQVGEAPGGVPTEWVR